MPKTDRQIAVLLVFLAAASSAVAQGTFFLKPYSLEGSAIQGLVEQQACWLVKVDKPEGLKGEPGGLTGRVYWYQGEVGGKKVVALVHSGKTRQLYIDLDGDGDLANEKPITSKRVRSNFDFGWSMAYRFGPLTFAGKDEPPARSTGAPAAARTESAKPAPAGKPAPRATDAKNEEVKKDDEAKKDNETEQPSDVTGFFAEQMDLDYLVIRPVVCRRGLVRIGDKSFNAYVTDGNFNGRYDDVFTFQLNRKVARESLDSDLIAFDVNRNGQIEPDYYGLGEMQPLTRLVQLHGAYYSMQMAADGTSLTLDEATPVMGKLQVGEYNAEMIVRSENGMFRTASQEGVCELPVGAYRLSHVQLRAPDDKKVEWTLRGSSLERKPCEFKVDADKATAIKLGSGLKVQVSQRSHRTLLSGRVVSFGVSFVDGAGVEYQPGAESRGKRGAPPSVKIYDESGKTLSVGQFEYG